MMVRFRFWQDQFHEGRVRSNGSLSQVFAHGGVDAIVAADRSVENARSVRAFSEGWIQDRGHGAACRRRVPAACVSAGPGPRGLRGPGSVYYVVVTHKVTLIPGDGIGPEVAAAVVRILDAAGVAIEWDRVELSTDVILAAGKTLPDPVLASLDRTRVGLKGPVTTPVAGGFSSVNVALRKRLDLFANVRPVRTVPGLKTRYQDVQIDMVIFRENTEDLYSGLEHEVVKDVVESLKIITRHASIRIAEYAFEFARKQDRRQVTAVHKANIMKLSDGLFLRCCREVAERYAGIEYKELIVDNASLQLVMRPETFDVLLLPNLYGDIVSDLAAGLVGGLGIVPGANMGEKHAVFEAVHGSAPDIAGKGVANPTALLQSSILMLRHLGESTIANRVQAAMERTYAEGKALTPDVGGRATTEEFVGTLIGHL